ncbi:Uncharacterized protein OBRU01_01685 [Operophtera brumata]|uniref:MADF domain-containing protein n=1 Tax=Operophtera brumata TaxID=104452 RepID=A0A0L7LTG8_OPEBR|nr:Uncharacterized protein OBRU01_01685 [Operophtera brumata]
MDWNNKSHSCIWNPKHKHHRERNRVSEAWADIQNNMPMPCTVQQLKKKKESLMSAYRSYKTKIKNTTTTSGVSMYRPSWFAFEAMDSFLSSVYLCNYTSTCHRENDANVQHATDSTAGDGHGADTKEAEELTLEFVDTKRCMPSFKRSHSPDQQIKRPMDQHETYQAKRRMDQHEAFNPPQHKSEDDECDIIAKLWARKLRKLPEDRRDILIYKINNLMYGESISHSLNRGNTPTDVMMSPVQIFKEDHETESRHSADSMTDLIQ